MVDFQQQMNEAQNRIDAARRRQDDRDHEARQLVRDQQIIEQGRAQVQALQLQQAQQAFADAKAAYGPKLAAHNTLIEDLYRVLDLHNLPTALSLYAQIERSFDALQQEKLSIVALMGGEVQQAASSARQRDMLVAQTSGLPYEQSRWAGQQSFWAWWQRMEQLPNGIAAWTAALAYIDRFPLGSKDRQIATGMAHALTGLWRDQSVKFNAQAETDRAVREFYQRR